MTDKTKTGRDGDSLNAQFLRHKDAVFAGLNLEVMLKEKPTGSPPPKEWTHFITAAGACHKAMDHLRDNESPEAFEEAKKTADAFAAAARAWQTVVGARPAAPSPSDGDEDESEADTEDADDGEDE